MSKNYKYSRIIFMGHIYFFMYSSSLSFKIKILLKNRCIFNRLFKLAISFIREIVNLKMRKYFNFKLGT